MEYKLSDTLIAQIAKSLQIAMLTGTDIVDNLRLIKVTIDDEEIVPTKDSTEVFESGIERMMEEIENTKPSSF